MYYTVVSNFKVPYIRDYNDNGGLLDMDGTYWTCRKRHLSLNHRGKLNDDMKLKRRGWLQM